MKNISLVFFLFFSLLSFGQINSEYAPIDAKMAAVSDDSSASIATIGTYINTNFKTDKDKIRAAFYWTASNISYDVANMFTVSSDETELAKIAKTLQTKKGVCSHYASVFNALCRELGIQSYIISGYTKQSGKVDNLAHAWTAAKIDGSWYIFDPTWGAGYVNKGKFYKKINNAYFKVAPTKIIASHIPFDYLWQFLNYPITNGEFYEGKTQLNKLKKYFDFEKEIIRYNASSEIDQLFETAARIEKNGLKNAMIIARYESNKEQIVYLRQNKNIEKLNSIVIEMNEAVVLLNDFIHYRNRKFKPAFSDEVIHNMIQIPTQKLAKCQNDIYDVGTVGSENASNLASIKKTIGAALAQAEEHNQFVKNYLSKSKIIRKTMFSKVSWYGVPLN
ncbi:transglutaminase domain-containing protein [Flavobacterium sp. W22_SRS_FP1]|uniref:transglutaminase domain-containing protein n=1 Tax=Flavobacterium sp. W22_SRS_FP1 TaxID=3240276 RepID=UPI003F90D99F